MKWDFTHEQVASGEVKYTVEEFRKDFYEEVKMNFPEYSASELESMFRLAYFVCYSSAVQQDLNKLLRHLNEKEVQADKKYLELIRDSNLENIEMLKAVLGRKVSQFMEEGTTIQDALKKLEKYHEKLLKN
jgi:plasmid stabilization system protein ParE